MRRILVISSDFRPMPGGVAELSWQITREFARRGYLIDVATSHLTTGQEEMQGVDGIRIHRLFDALYVWKRFPSLPRRIRKWLWIREVQKEVGRFIRRGMWDLIFFTNYHKAWYGIIKKTRIPYFLYLHGEDVTVSVRCVNPWNPYRLSKLLYGASWIFFNSRYSMQQVRRYLGGISDRCTVTGCGFSLEEMKERCDRGQARAMLGRPEGPVLLTACRLILRKGIDTTIRALPLVLPVFPDCRYIILGDGPDRETLESLVRQLNLTNHVYFLGYVSTERKKQVYFASDLYVMPSRPGIYGEVEGFGISFLEAHAYGLAAIGSTAGGIPDAIQDGETGILVEPNDPSALAQAIVTLLGQPDVRRMMAEKGKQQIQDKYNWEQIVNQIEEKISQIVKNR